MAVLYKSHEIEESQEVRHAMAITAKDVARRTVGIRREYTKRFVVHHNVNERVLAPHEINPEAYDHKLPHSTLILCWIYDRQIHSTQYKHITSIIF
jgi:hypothetical protein